MVLAGFFWFFSWQISADGKDYPLLGGDVERSGWVGGKGLDKPQVAWKYQEKEMRVEVEGKMAVQTVIKKGMVYVVTEDSRLLALDLKSGKEKWVFEAKKEIGPETALAGIAAGNKYIFSSLTAVSSGNAQILAVEAVNGKVAWRQKIAAGVSHSLPLMIDDYLLIGDDAGFLYKLRQDDGEEIWRKDLLTNQIHSSPTFGEGLIFIGTEGNSDPETEATTKSFMYALKMEDGEVVWRFPIKIINDNQKEEFVHGTAAYKDGRVFFGSENNEFYALEAKTGKLIWQYTAGGWFTSAPAVDEEKVYIGCWDGNIEAFNQGDGRLVWQYNVEKDAPFEMGSLMGRPQKQGINSWPLVTDDKLFLGTSNGYFYAFDKKEGRVVWKEEYGQAWPAMAEGVLVLANRSSDKLDEKGVVVALADFSRGGIFKQGNGQKEEAFLSSRKAGLGIAVMSGAALVFYWLFYFWRRRSS